MEIVYSVIIPHKDIPCLLQRCLDSIPPRDDVQIIVVDDNSSPDIVDFAHFPGQDRTDVPVIADLPAPKADGWYSRTLMIFSCLVFWTCWIFTGIRITT